MYLCVYVCVLEEEEEVGVSCENEQRTLQAGVTD